jgi:hypothetical protein
MSVEGVLLEVAAVHVVAKRRRATSAGVLACPDEVVAGKAVGDEIGADQPVPVGERDRLRAAVHPELGQDPLDVGRHRLGADMELRCDRLGPLALGEQAEYLRLSLGELREHVLVPAVLGQRARLFRGAGPDIALDLVDSRADSKGVTIQVYRPTGRPQYATATTD